MNTFSASRSGFGAEEFAAEHGAEEEVVKFAGEAVDAKQSADLRPVAGLVEQDMRDDFPRCGAKRASEKIEFFENIPFTGRERFDEVP